MTPASDLTVKETAQLAGVTASVVEKALETKVLKAIVRKARRRGGATRFLPVNAVIYLAAIKAAKLTDLPVKYKKALWAQLKALEVGALKPVEFAPMAILKVDELVSEPYEKALRYVNARDAYIVSDPEILGGTPVIANTRITVYSVLARLQDGESLDEIAGDYPVVPREAFEAAAIYAKSNPLMGRPKRPWHAAA